MERGAADGSHQIRWRKPELTAQAWIGCTVNFRSITTMSYYKNRYGFKFGDFPESDAWGSSVISLPFYPGLTAEEQDAVIASVMHNLEELT